MLEISTILKNAQAGDGESMELILKSFKSKVNAICREYFLIGSDFDDILREGMIGLYKAIQTYDDKKNDNFSRYASLCIHRQIQSAVKVANSKKNLPLNDYYSISNDGEIESDNEKNPSIILVTKDRVAEKISLAKEKNTNILKQIKQILNEQQFKVLIYYLNGYSYNEIASIIDEKSKKIDNIIQQIKRKLKSVTFEN